jgi:DNA-binding MarR family transcriptional regulator
MDVKTDGPRSDPGLVSLLTQLQKALHRRSSEELLGMRLKPYAVVLILNELEAAQFSIRRRDPQDRRRHIVEMTPAGRRALERADKARESLEDEVLAPLSPEERTTLRSLVQRVLDGLLAESRV